MANFRIEAALYLTLTLLVCHVVAKSLQKRDDSSRYEETASDQRQPNPGSYPVGVPGIEEKQEGEAFRSTTPLHDDFDNSVRKSEMDHEGINPLKGVAGVNKQDITTAKVAPNSVENIGSQTQPPLGSNVNQSANVGDKAELADTSKVDPGTARLPGIYKVGGDMSDSQTDLKHVPNDNQSGILVQPSSGYSIPVNGTVQSESQILQGPPESGSYKGNLPAEGRNAQGPPESGYYQGNLPAEGRNAQGPPESGSYKGNLPAEGRNGISSDKQNTSTRGSDAPTGTVNRGNIQPVTDAREVLVQGAGSGQGGASSINTVKPVNPQDLPVKQEDLLMVLSTTTSALPDWQNSQPFPNNANPDDNAIEPEDDIDDIDDIDEMDDDEEDEAQYGDDDDDDDEDLQNSYDYNRQNAPSNINQQRINLPLNNNPNQKVNVEPDPVIESSGHFMAYFIVLMIAVVAGYLVYHNRQKVLAFIIEGRNGRKNPRRPSSSEYKKLASNVDEAVMSLGEKTSPQNIIY